MNNTEEQHPVFIPRNFIEKGTFMGGMVCYPHIGQ